MAEINKLATAKFNSLVTSGKAGTYSDGSGLYLRVTAKDTAAWVFRYQSKGKVVQKGLGATKSRGLADARKIAEQMRAAIAAGVDPVTVLKPKHDPGAKTFKTYAESVIKAKEDECRNGKHLKQWTSTLEAYCYGKAKGVPNLGAMRPREITYPDIEAVLGQKALKNADGELKRETVSRLRQRIATILDEAARSEAEPHRYNPAVSWRMPKRKRGEAVKHHAAASWRDVPTIMASLREKDATSALLLRFSILTAARSGEVRGALWAEIENDRWVIPPDRMKAHKLHIVPLSQEALAVLKIMKKRSGENKYIFPGPRGGMLSDVAVAKVLKSVWAGVTAHGFRSSFRDWVAEATNFDPAAAEWALAHSPKNKVEGAYQRVSLLDKRVIIMASWDKYLAGEPNITQLFKEK